MPAGSACPPWLWRWFRPVRARPTGSAPCTLEIKLLEYLRVPLAGLTQPEPASEPRPGADGVVGRAERLRQAVWELRQDAAAIGTIPSGYPRHIEFVMRAISALLPWYTRNLVRFGQRTAETVELIAETVEEALRRQPPR